MDSRFDFLNQLQVLTERKGSHIYVQDRVEGLVGMYHCMQSFVPIVGCFSFNNVATFDFCRRQCGSRLHSYPNRQRLIILIARRLSMRSL